MVVKQSKKPNSISSKARHMSIDMISIAQRCTGGKKEENTIPFISYAHTCRIHIFTQLIVQNKLQLHAQTPI